MVAGAAAGLRSLKLDGKVLPGRQECPGQRAAPYKSEYYQGGMFARAGAREADNPIAGNLYAELHRQLRSRPCRVYMSDRRVPVPASGLYTYPDVTAVCGGPQFPDETRDTLLNPGLSAEVLSPSPEAYDRGRRFEHYRSIGSASEYLPVATERVSAELFTRQPDGRWLLTAAGRMEDALDLQSVGCRLSLADLYEGVDFGGAPVVNPWQPGKDLPRAALATRRADRIWPDSLALEPKSCPRGSTRVPPRAAGAGGFAIEDMRLCPIPRRRRFGYTSAILIISAGFPGA
jgi:Uma2 family endonuclease